LLLSKPRRRRPSRDEERLQAAICEFHRTCVIDPLKALLFAVPNGEARDPVTAGKLTGISTAEREKLEDRLYLLPFGLGVVPGVADLILLTSQDVDLIELKRPAGPETLFGRRKMAGRQKRGQRLFQAAAEALGHRYHLIDSLDGYADLLEARGVRLRAREWGPGMRNVLPVKDTA
jgi:hypothetical protein